MKLLLALTLLCFTTAAFAVTPKEVSYQSGDETVHALLYLPAGEGQHPAVVVIHEWWGLVDWVKQQASDLADQGYVAIAVDLYRGKSATDADTAHQLMRGLPQDRGVRDLLAAVTFLKQQKNVDPSRIGAVGWCMGGGYAAQLAVADPTLKAVAINYGSLPTDHAALANIHADVLGNFGGLDKGITPDDVHTFANAMKTMGRAVDIKVYPDAGHAFENPANKEGYRPEDAQDAKQRINAFFTRTLKK